MQKSKIVLLSLAIILLSGCGQPAASVKNTAPDSASIPVNIASNSQNTTSTSNENNNLNNKDNKTMDTTTDYTKQYSQATIKTSLGEITVKLSAASAPKTVNNFLKLAVEKFYDGTKFHRVIKGFMIQGGDPNSKSSNVNTWGMGGPGYKFDDELTGKETYPQGTLAMANSGPNTNGSQFFIVTATPGAPLPPSYTVFGQVVSGMDVALKIENVKTGVNDRPE